MSCSADQRGETQHLTQEEAEACTAAMAGKDLLITPILGVDSAESISAMLGCDDKVHVVIVIG